MGNDSDFYQDFTTTAMNQQSRLAAYTQQRDIFTPQNANIIDLLSTGSVFTPNSMHNTNLVDFSSQMAQQQVVRASQ